jgi:hypothetical protein
MIQDYIYTAGSIIFILSLLPAVFSKEKPPRSTCALTGGVLYVYAVNGYTLDLYFTAITTLITAAVWTVLLFQRRSAIVLE